jgi:hypothetical protein
MSKVKQTESTIKLSEESLNELRDFLNKINDVKYEIDNLSGEKNISTVMYTLGSAAHMLNEIEIDLESLIESLEPTETDNTNS